MTAAPAGWYRNRDYHLLVFKQLKWVAAERSDHQLVAMGQDALLGHARTWLSVTNNSDDDDDDDDDEENLTLHELKKQNEMQKKSKSKKRKQ